MNILISNDDGYGANGINSLVETLRPNHQITVVAPMEERSTTGHSLSLDKPLRLQKIKENEFSCSGFPSDCVLMGVAHIMKNGKPDVVISGINRGANLGQDLYYSGTIAAAREGVFHRIPAMAVSLVLQALSDVHHYESAAKFIEYALEFKLHSFCPPMTLLNINVPNLPMKEIKGSLLTEVGFRRYSEDIHARVDARGRDYFWIAGLYEGFDENPKSDCRAIHEHKISVTPHSLIDGCDRNFEALDKCIKRINEKYFS